MGLFNRWSLNVLFIFASAIYIAGLLIDVLEVDSAQYASISGEMFRSGSYLEVYQNGKDYLDKPPLIFWTSTLMFHLFGIHNWSFKLASLIFSLIGVLSTYKLGYLLYNKRVGFVAALMLITCQAFFLYNSDVRTDALLTGAVAFSIWQLVAYLYTNKWLNLVLGFAGIGIAMLAKGPIGLMVPILALGSYLVGRQQFRSFFKWQWLVGLGITCLVLLPMSYGLYTQFDAHPEKILLFHSDAGNQVKTGVSGLRFYFWEQSFGRITGENVWKDNSGPDFFFGIFAYSFLPWSLIGFMAIAWRLFNAIRDFILKRKKQEWLTLGGFILPFIAFSMSSYKLDHYIYVTYPFAAIITSEYVLRVIFEKAKWWVNAIIIIQGAVIVTSLALAILLLSYVFPTTNFFIWLIFTLLMSLTFYFYFFTKDPLQRIILASIFVALSVNWVMNIHFFPTLSHQFQPGHKMVNYLSENNIDSEDVIIAKGNYRHQMNFYGKTIYNVIDIRSSKEFNPTEEEGKYIYLKEEDLDWMRKQNIEVEIKKDFQWFHVTLLTPEFLNPKTRSSTLNTDYLVKLVD